jgi:hypothetical protein
MFSKRLSGSLPGSFTETGNTYLMFRVNCFSIASFQYFQSIKTGMHRFKKKMYEPLQNSSRLNGHINQFPYRGLKILGATIPNLVGRDLCISR